MSFRVILLMTTTIFLLITGCCKKAADTTTVVNNKSGESVFMTFYSSTGEQDISVKNDSAYIYRNGALLANLILDLYMVDSMVVDFGGKKRVTHYAKGKPGNGSSSLSFDNPRNLLNEYNYRREVITDKKCSYYAEYYYTLTPEDAG